MTSLATVKARLGIADSDTSKDAAITRLINECSRTLCGSAYLNREPWRQGYTVQLAGFGIPQLYMPAFPIESVSSVTRDGVVVDPTEYSIAGTYRDHLYRASGMLWDWTAQVASRLIDNPQLGTEKLLYLVTLVAGWLMPGEVTDWAASTVVKQWSWTRASDPTVQLRFQATAITVDDKTGASEPTWPTASDGTGVVVDNHVTWTAYPAAELPYSLERACWVLIQEALASDRSNPLVQSISKGGASITYAKATPGYGGICTEAAGLCMEFR